MRPRIGVDVTPLLYTANGIGRSTGALLDAMFRLRDPGVEFVLFGRRLAGARLARNGWPARTVHLRLPRKAEPVIRSFGLFERACGADLYHATDFYAPLKRPDRAVATIHDVIFLTHPEPMVDHARLARWVGAFARQSRAIVTCSEWCKAEIVRVLQVDPRRVHVVYWGVDQSTFHPEGDEEALRARLRDRFGLRRPYFVAVSCSTGRKNTPRLLRAYERFVAAGGDHDLVAVWDAPAEVRAAHERLVAAGRLHFTGRVPDATLRDLYAGASAAVYPSLQEGFGLPLLEAMSCGTPVITSRATCLPEVAGDAAVYVDPHDEQDIGRGLDAIASGREDAGALRVRGLRRAAGFSWERCAQGTLDVYRAALADRPGRGIAC